jgi:hypothetical protein
MFSVVRLSNEIDRLCQQQNQTHLTSPPAVPRRRRPAAETLLPFWPDCLCCLAINVTRSTFDRFTPTDTASADATICHLTCENETL